MAIALRAWRPERGVLPERRRYLALMEGQPAASAELVLHEGVGYLSNAATLPSFRRRGLHRALIAAHRSAEPGHGRVLDALGLEPYLDFGMRLGEGTGAALCIGLARAALAVLTEMATFKSAGVTDRAGGPGSP